MADRHRHGVVSGHVECREESTRVPPSLPLPEFPSLPAGTPLSEAEPKFICVSKAAPKALENYYLATAAELVAGRPLCSHPGRKLSAAALELEWKPIACMVDLLVCAAACISVTSAPLPLSLRSEDMHLRCALRQYTYQRMLLAVRQGALRGRRSPPKLPMLFAREAAAAAVSGQTSAREKVAAEPVRGCAAHCRWLNPFLWAGERWRRVKRRFYPFFEGNEVESAGNTFAHLEAERFSGGRRTLHVCDMATDTVITAVLVNLEKLLARKVASLEEAETIIDAARRLTRRDNMGGGLHTVMHIILMVLVSSWNPLGVGAIKDWLKRTDMRPDREAQQVKRKLEFIIVIVTAWMCNALDNFADSRFYKPEVFWTDGNFDQEAYLDAFQAFVDANSHDTECLKHATIVTKVTRMST